jgi:radical SAM superfamily enzyme YgiQ (UPF0313 family)
MGIESGVEQGLKILHKEMTVQQNLAGVQTLKDVGIFFSYGFMLFDPSSTFQSVRENLNFLRKIVGYGSAAATFCRMLPYGGTPIRDLLLREGRLRGTLTQPDYDFLDVRLNQYYRQLSQTIRFWIHNNGISNELNYAVRRLVPGVQGIEGYSADLRSLAKESNERLFALVEQSSLAFEQGDRTELDPDAGREYCEGVGTRLARIRNNFVADNLYLLMDAVNPDCASGPVLAPQIH